MNKTDIKRAKAAILKCLTEDFEYGQAPKRRKKNQAIFDGKAGFAVYNGTDLQMVMDKVVLGLYLALEDKS